MVGMIVGMTRKKIAITLPEEQVEAARHAVADGRAASVSAYISEALARRDADEELREMLAEMAAEYGPPSEADRAWARRALGLDQ
jgi:Arc/MetJ-type ribon-helix-helix transcriptional regulator